METENKEIFSKNLKKFIAKSGKDRNEVAKDLDMSYSTLTEWINGKKYPRIHNVEKLAEYFGISKSDLIEDFEKTKKDNDRLATIIVKMRTNKDLLDIVDQISSMDKTQLGKLKQLFDTFL